ncbi:MAG TPA: hypothetical protein VFO79_05450 [Xanthomonadales bacterium]|nr:hypothetical protein [Xanthomonadales bacterium]
MRAPHLRLRLAGIVMLGVLLGVAPGARTQSSGGPYEIRAHAAASGGAAQAGSFGLHGVVGQASAGTAAGGVYAASVGLLRQRAALPDALFADGFE